MTGGVSRFSVAILLYHSFLKSSLGTLRCFRLFLAAKTSIGCEGHITSSRRIFPVSHHRKISLATRLFFKKLLAAKTLYGWQKGISRFSVEKFLNHSTGKFHWELFVVSEKSSDIGRNIWTRRGVSQKFVIFSRDARGDITFFRRNFLVSQYH